MFSWISRSILKLFGWKIKGDYPHQIPKVMLVAAPHTSNWDFPIGVLVRSAVKADIMFIAKDSLFKPPFGYIFKALGGYPVVRDRRTNFVQTMVNIYNKEARFHTVIAPEGTRKHVDKLRTGFYYIALGAKAALVMVAFDWGKKEVRFSEPFYPSGDLEADFGIINDYFQNVKGKVPENSYMYSR